MLVPLPDQAADLLRTPLVRRQVRMNGVDSNVVASMRNARVELARVTFTARAAGLAEVTGLLVEVKQQQGQPLKDRPFQVRPFARTVENGRSTARKQEEFVITHSDGWPLAVMGGGRLPCLCLAVQAGAGFVRIGDSAARRHLHGATRPQNGGRPLLRSKMTAPAGKAMGTAPRSPPGPQRGLLQSTCTLETARLVIGDINSDCIFDLAGNVLTMDQAGPCAPCEITALSWLAVVAVWLETWLP